MGISGKCDFEDTCSMFSTPQEILEKYQVYAYGNDIVPLKMETEKDLIAYYPYLVTMMYSNKKDGGTIYLSSESYIDSEEREHIEYKLNKIKKYYRKCKRQKRTFNKEEALRIVSWYDSKPQDYETTIVNRVAELGEKATTEDLHDPMHEHMRKEWLDLMIKAGWDRFAAYRWVYGWKRYYTKIKNDDLTGIIEIGGDKE